MYRFVLSIHTTFCLILKQKILIYISCITTNLKTYTRFIILYYNPNNDVSWWLIPCDQSCGRNLLFVEFVKTDRNQICCRVARCGTARNPFDHFKIHVNSDLKVLIRILKWSNGLRAAPYRAARRRVLFFRIKWYKLIFFSRDLCTVFFDIFSIIQFKEPCSSSEKVADSFPLVRLQIP
jgi:hypothetical protein